MEFFLAGIYHFLQQQQALLPNSKKVKLYILKNSTALASERDRSHERETSSV